jgi:hypothetical protein
MIHALPFNKLRYQFFNRYLFAVSSSEAMTFKYLIVHVGNIIEDAEYHIGLNALYDLVVW